MAIFNRCKSQSSALSSSELMYLLFCSELMADDSDYDLAAQLKVHAMTPPTLRESEFYQHFLEMFPGLHHRRVVKLKGGRGGRSERYVVVQPKPSIVDMLDSREPGHRERLTAILADGLKQLYSDMVRERETPPPIQDFATADVFAYAFNHVPPSSLRPELIHVVLFWVFYCYARDTGKYLFVSETDYPELVGRKKPIFPALKTLLESWQAAGVAPWSNDPLDDIGTGMYSLLVLLITVLKPCFMASGGSPDESGPEATSSIMTRPRGMQPSLTDLRAQASVWLRSERFCGKVVSILAGSY
jgi:hypothetical protein